MSIFMKRTNTAKEASMYGLLINLKPSILLHMRRVSEYVGIIARTAQKLDVYAQELNRYEPLIYNQAAFYHDIGKLRIPDRILDKPGSLTREEAALVSRHPEFAVELLQHSGAGELWPPSLFDTVLNCAVYHHERWDGEGYPFGLRKDNIPLIARITAIADTYDTLTTGRTLSSTLHSQYACSEIIKGAEKQFDPLLVEVFTGCTELYQYVN